MRGQSSKDQKAIDAASSAGDNIHMDEQVVSGISRSFDVWDVQTHANKGAERDIPASIHQPIRHDPQASATY